MSQGLSQGLAWVDSTQLPNLQEAELERLLGTVKNRRTVINRKFRTEPARNRKWNRNRNRNNLTSKTPTKMPLQWEKDISLCVTHTAAEAEGS